MDGGAVVRQKATREHQYLFGRIKIAIFSAFAPKNRAPRLKSEIIYNIFKGANIEREPRNNIIKRLDVTIRKLVFVYRAS